MGGAAKFVRQAAPILCVAIAGVLAWYDTPNWGWFLFIAFVAFTS